AQPLAITYGIPYVQLREGCSQTAPLNELSELAGGFATASIRESLYKLWVEWGEALFMTGAFLCVLLAICYGSALGTWGNPIAMYLFFISVIAFPVGVILNMDIQLHILTRGLAFLFLGGILLQAPAEEEQL
ncbi:MAG: hypothetical protein OXI24_19700, partial [Candidatus Poribacteria bacterium]|nr:hypothetical protein [Candidatus Poribacteria bacterium]